MTAGSAPACRNARATAIIGSSFINPQSRVSMESKPQSNARGRPGRLDCRGQRADWRQQNLVGRALRNKRWRRDAGGASQSFRPFPDFLIVCYYNVADDGDLAGFLQDVGPDHLRLPPGTTLHAG